MFREVKHVKPRASRTESVELYLVALGFPVLAWTRSPREEMAGVRVFSGPKPEGATLDQAIGFAVETMKRMEDKGLKAFLGRGNE